MSTPPISLKELEHKAYRATFQDGLLDISQGGLVASFAVLADVLGSNEDVPGWERILLFLVGAILSQLVFWLGKRFITLPRIGQVKFGAARMRRARTLAWVLGGIVALQVLIVLFTVVLGQIPGLGVPLLSRDMNRLTVAVIGALFVGPPMAVMAYFSDFPRQYYIAVVLSLSVFCMIWFSNPLLMLAGAALVMLPGVVLLFRFLRQHPLPEVQHD
jgi:hypothetical protein